jgi:hypothetical protein
MVEPKYYNTAALQAANEEDWAYEQYIALMQQWWEQADQELEALPND